MDVKRVNQMIDVKDVAADVENFQNESEEWNATQHHVREIAEEGRDKESHFRSMLAHLFLRSRFDPALKWS